MKMKPGGALTVEDLSDALDLASAPARKDATFEHTLASPLTLKLPAGMSAVAAARLYALNLPTLALVVEPGSGRPIAVFRPEEIARRHSKTHVDADKALEQLIEDLGKGIAPRVTPMALTMHYCEIGRHYVAQSRCPVHEA